MQVGLESFARVQNLTSAQYDFRTKLRDTNFNYHFSYYIHFEIAKFSFTDTASLSLHTYILLI